MMFDKPTGAKCIILEGNIGAGKSTLLSIIESIKGLSIIYEPVNMWQNIGSDNLLEKFYQDPQRWSYTFQSYAFLTRVLAVQQAMQKSASLYILERSVYSDRYCFAQNAFESGLMSALEWTMYKEWFDWLVVKNTFVPDGFIYMRTTPLTCLERIEQRNRSEEQKMSASYLEQLHHKHEDWLVNKKSCPWYLNDVPVTIINCDQEFEHDKEYQAIILQQIELFAQQL